MNTSYDLLIIGGGINGCAIAADAQMRGLSVVLCERADLASGTSSNSSKLIHGGLRYLESYQWSLVRKALKERDILLDVCRHFVKPQPFILPHTPNNRPFCLLRAGLFIYDHLYQGSLPKTQIVTRHKTPDYFIPLNDKLQKGFKYYDAKTNDARLVIVNALQAAKHGADILTHTEVTNIEPRSIGWRATVKTAKGYHTIDAKVVINATGPQANELNRKLNIPCPIQLSLVKGSHIIIPKHYQGDHAYILQHHDNRVVFCIPHNKQYLLVGTTEIAVSASTKPTISETEINYLLEVLSQYFNRQFSKAGILHTFSGIRALLNTTSTITSESRDYKIDIQHDQSPPFVTIYGGKITTYRILAKQCLDSLTCFLPKMYPCKTHMTPLPCNEYNDYNTFLCSMYKHYHWLPKPLLNRYIATYGSQLPMILSDKTDTNHLGKYYGFGLYDAEIEYLKKFEWAKSLDDIISRRTDHITRITLKEREQLEKELSK